MFRLFGIPVRVDPWFFILPAFALQTRDLVGAAVWAALVFLSVLVHELGHALAMKRVGLQPAILLHGLGGTTSAPPTANLTPKHAFFIDLAGPGAGLVLGGFALAGQYLITVPSAVLATALADAVWINLGWSLINLLPILPWDGGNALDAGLRWLTGRAWSRLVAVSSIVGGALVLALAARDRSMLLGYFGVLGVAHGARRWSAAANGEH